MQARLWVALLTGAVALGAVALGPRVAHWRQSRARAVTSAKMSAPVAASMAALDVLVNIRRDFAHRTRTSGARDGARRRDDDRTGARARLCACAREADRPPRAASLSRRFRRTRAAPPPKGATPPPDTGSGDDRRRRARGHSRRTRRTRRSRWRSRRPSTRTRVSTRPRNGRNARSRSTRAPRRLTSSSRAPTSRMDVTRRPAPATNATWSSLRAAGTKPKRGPRCDGRSAAHTDLPARRRTNRFSPFVATSTRSPGRSRCPGEWR